MLTGLNSVGKLETGSITDDKRVLTQSRVSSLSQSIAFNRMFNGMPAKVVTVFGRRNDGWASSSIPGDVCNYLDATQALQNSISPATTYFIKSSSANDTDVSGTGARSVHITYMNTLGNEVSMTVLLNGTTAISIGSGILAIQSIHVATSGSGRLAAGNISVANTSGAHTTANKVAQLDLGTTRSMPGRYTVPAGYTALVTSWYCSATNGDMQAYLNANSDPETDAHTAGQYITHDLLFVPTDTADHEYDMPLRFNEGTTILFSATPSATGAGNRCDITCTMLLLNTAAANGSL